MAELKDANTNPWYVLMTLYGEQTGDEIDEELHEKNRRVWNAWSCQNLSDAEAEQVAKTARVDLAEVRAWPEIAADVAARHQEEMTARNGSDFNYIGMPDVSEFMDCLEIQFFNTVVLKNCIFTQDANFARATFMQDADFYDATFTQVAGFSHATFTQVAGFSHATFTQVAYFTHAAFTQVAYFSHATFTQVAYFSNATFTQDAYFYRTTFTQLANFARATFMQDADFYDAEFKRSASFIGVTIIGFSRFQRAQFLASMEQVIGEGKHEVKIDFTDCHFEKSTSFRDAVFAEKYPILVGAVLHQNTDFSADAGHWPNTLQQYPKEARESCAKIRHAVGKQGLPEDEHFFFRREMTYAGQYGKWFDRFPYRVFGLVSDYGHSILRPAVGLGILWIVPALVYTIAFEWMLIMGGKREVSLDGFGLSFANIFKFFGFQRTYYDIDDIQALHGALQVMGAAQTVFGFILLFFLGLGLRTRFRMR